MPFEQQGSEPLWSPRKSPVDLKREMEREAERARLEKEAEKAYKQKVTKPKFIPKKK